MSLRLFPSFLALLIVVAVVGACTGTPGAAASRSPVAVTASAAPTAAPAATPTSVTPTGAAPTGTATAAASAAMTQSDTEWGRIWDALPPSFPQFPGSLPAQTGAGPASAVLQIPARVEIAADWFGISLEAAGFTIATIYFGSDCAFS